MTPTPEHNVTAESARMARFLLLTFLVFAVYITSGYEAFAGLKSAVNTVYDAAKDIVKGLAHLAVFALGVAAVFGRISVTQALVVATGITIAANASDLADVVTGSMKTTIDNVDGIAGQMTSGLGVIAIIGLGIGAMFGRISITQALVLAIGVVLLGGYADIADEIIAR
ncbi:MAG: hypothetical protein EBR02_07755 [Alphaproteobacteria bacterium]|nr:hypothetical protein [Alphaproteobacteria bacterium]